MFACILGAPRIRDQEMAEEERTSLDSDGVNLVLTGWSMLRSGYYAASWFCCVGMVLVSSKLCLSLITTCIFSAATTPYLVGEKRPKEATKSTKHASCQLQDIGYGIYF